MKIDILQHVSFEGPGAIQEWGDIGGHECHLHKLYQDPTFPALRDLEFLIILGGPMSANDLDKPWIAAERRLIKAAVSTDKPVFGVCLGAQQIAKALGAEIIHGDKEVGWHPVQSVSAKLPFIPDEMTVFHWHGEQFNLPDGAERLFSSKACKNQGFIYNEKVIGLQFHIETIPESVRLLLSHDGDYIDQATYVQSAEEIANFTIPAINRQVLFNMLDYLTAGGGSLVNQ